MRDAPGMRDAPVAEEMSGRKAQHLDVCLDANRYHVETGSSRLNQVHLVHRALPECDLSEVNTEIPFLGTTVKLPFFISSMTGGSAEGYRTNKDLAEVAAELGIPVGMGSIRILTRKPEVIGDFQLKRFAPNVPVFANIGGVQLPNTQHQDIYRLMEQLAVDGIAVHLNPAQELFQPGGDTDFFGVLEATERFIAASPVPVIIKETGMGINPAEVRELLKRGAAAVDVAGAGGTNWVRVESYRLDDTAVAEEAGEFDNWGIPTALVLAALGRDVRNVWASGGIRSGMDIVNALALGADAVGLALPFVRAVRAGGVAAGVELGRRYEYVIRIAMTLTGSRTVEQLRAAPLYLDAALQADARSLAAVMGV